MSISTVAKISLCFSLLLPVLCVGLYFPPPYKIVGPVIGIDLGTTYSCVGVHKDGRTEIIANDQGSRLTPSWVAFTDTERLIGEAAKNQSVQNSERTIFDVKRLIGRRFDDPEVQRDLKFLPYKIVNKDGKPYIQVKVKGEEKVFSPEEISAMILQKMKETAESYLGKKINDAVITVPAYFDNTQRQAVEDAGTLAGLNVAKIINEPTAAAMAYGLGKMSYGRQENFLVFDLGGRTFDVTILTNDVGVLEVIVTGGDSHLGVEDFDNRVMDYFIKLIKKKHGIDISKDKKWLEKLRRECEGARRALSNQHQVQVEIKSLFNGVDFSEPLTRERFEEVNMDLFKKILGLVEKALEDAWLKKSDIHEIVLVGGIIPNKVLELLKDKFNGKEPRQGVSNPDEAVAYGAAVQGAILGGNVEDETRGFKPWSSLEDIEYEKNGCLTEEELERMMKEAEELAEDRKIASRNRLETYLYNMKIQIHDIYKLTDKIDSEDKERIDSTLKEALEWLGVNQNAEKYEYEEKLEKIKAVCNPVVEGA